MPRGPGRNSVRRPRNEGKRASKCHPEPALRAKDRVALGYYNAALRAVPVPTLGGGNRGTPTPVLLDFYHTDPSADLWVTVRRRRLSRGLHLALT